jgi:hypothetical protein
LFLPQPCTAGGGIAAGEVAPSKVNVGIHSLSQTTTLLFKRKHSRILELPLSHSIFKAAPVLFILVIARDAPKNYVYDLRISWR